MTRLARPRPPDGRSATGSPFLPRPLPGQRLNVRCCCIPQNILGSMPWPSVTSWMDVRTDDGGQVRLTVREWYSVTDDLTIRDWAVVSNDLPGAFWWRVPGFVPHGLAP